MLSGVLITGGDGRGGVEIFSPGKTTTHCKIDFLPEEILVEVLM